ncbi:MAG: metallophosphoesterase [Blastochloris sp.]|nr:metallophosphoesterase [Blastochloris sp.]
MTAPRRAVDYTLFRHVTEQLLARISGDGWPAALAHRYGLQRNLVTNSYTLTLAPPVPPRPLLRIVFASDFHAGPTTHPQTLLNACQALSDARPDVLLLGGDFVSLESRYIDVLAEALAHVSAPLGRFAVMGNHDLWADDVPIVRRLTQAGVQVLINQNIQLAPPFDHVWICGIDDPTSGRPDAATALHGADGVRVVVMHSPEGLHALQHHHFDLALCGHTHGGQICRPSGRPIWSPPGFYNQQYVYGRFQLGAHGRQTLIVSRGVGYGGLPIRLFAPPEIVVCTIR